MFAMVAFHLLFLILGYIACSSNPFANMCGLDIVAIGKPEWQVRKASHCGSKQQYRSPE